MGQALLAGSALAAYMAGLVAFFAPCCSFVMLPSYLASVAGARRWRMVLLSAVFIAGVATIVWPLTIGAAGLASLISAQHGLLFLAGGALMLLIGWATLNGWMWNPPALGASDRGGLAGIYSMGLVSGAVTACCAPVLAGAVAIAGVSASWLGGVVLGAIYLFGLVTPLILAGLGFRRLRNRMRDPQVRIGTLRTTRLRLISALMFGAVGVQMIVLALLDKASQAPAIQKQFGIWLSQRAAWVVEHVPTSAGWALVLAALALTAALSARALHSSPSAAPAAPVAPTHPHHCSHEEDHDG
jgi:cytochrome c-type biogenesis protein